MKLSILLATAVLLSGCGPRYRVVQWETVTVKPGDTLWELCDRANGDGADLRDCVSKCQPNSPVIWPGQRVRVPVYGRAK